MMGGSSRLHTSGDKTIKAKSDCIKSQDTGYF